MICATRSAPYLLADIGDHLVAPVLAEVDIEVRHRDALGIEEALEQKAEADRIEVGDGQRPGHDRAGARAAARPDRNALRLRPFDEVGHDQEVARKLHARDDVELEVEALLVVLLARGAQVQPGCAASRARKAGFGLRPQLGGLGFGGILRVGHKVAAGSACAVSGRKAQRLAISTVFSIASGKSAKSAAISACGFRQWSGERRRRSSSAT